MIFSVIGDKLLGHINSDLDKKSGAVFVFPLVWIN